MTSAFWWKVHKIASILVEDPYNKPTTMPSDSHYITSPTAEVSCFAYMHLKVRGFFSGPAPGMKHVTVGAQ